MSIGVEQLGDLMLLTRTKYRRNQWTDLTSDLQKYVAMPQILKSKKVKVRAGHTITFNVMTEDSGSARAVGLYEKDAINTLDSGIQGSIGWKHITANYAVDLQEIDINDADAIVDLINWKRHMCFVSYAKLFEQYFWGKPADSTDTKIPYGLFYWMVKNATLGFNGGAASGFPDGPAGISRTTYARTKNFTGSYAEISDTDALAKMRKAYAYTYFEGPISHPDQGFGRTDCEFFTVWENLDAMRRILKAQNENLGRDLSTMHGKVFFYSNPVHWVPFLEPENTAGIETLTGNRPIIAINWKWFRPVFRKGWFMKETKPMQALGYHNVRVVHIDTAINFECTNPREAAWILYKA